MSEHVEAERLLDFISSSPSVYHVVANMAAGLERAGFTRLEEKERFHLEEGGKYFVTRSSSSLIAFTIPRGRIGSARMIAAHTDSPTFKLKECPEETSSGLYTTLNVETYGGFPYSSWFDRPLSLAGRVQVAKGTGVECRLVDFARPIAVIPSLAIHQNRQVNEGQKVSVQKECKPLLCIGADKEGFRKLLAKELGVDKDDILSWDLSLVNRTAGCLWGDDDAFISSPRLDDLMCAYPAYRAIMEAEDGDKLQLVALFDNEEVGSSSRQGALSDFLSCVWDRIFASLSLGLEEKAMTEAASLMVSADNCHALHPNWSEKTDPTNKCVLNGGVAIKYSANQKYTTDSETASQVRMLCRKAGIPVQVFVNNSDVTGGSTLGNLSIRHLSVPSADVGLAQLAMHSSWETAGARDVDYITALFKAHLEA